MASLRAAIRITTVSIVATALLLALKLILGLISGSIAVLSDGLDSANDLLSAGAAFLSIQIAARPSDEEHPYGHGKAEGLSASVSAGVVGLGGGIVLWQAARRLIEGSPQINVGLGLIAVVAAVVVNASLAYIMRRVARRNGSLALASEATHLRTNVVQAATVILGLTLVGLTDQTVFDPLVAIGLALYMWWTAYTIIRGALGEIMDVSLPEREHQLIRECIIDHADRVRGFHHLRTRRSGPNRYLEVHLIVDPECTVRQAHELTDALEAQIRQRLPGTIATIHTEPDDGRYLGPYELVLRAAARQRQ